MAQIDWASETAVPSSAEALRLLQLGHERFRNGDPAAKIYSSGDISNLWDQQRPIAAIISCCDSRVSPEILFDQPLGSIFVSRVPGNVASDSAKWMLEIAVTELKVPVLMVVGHTGCLAIGQLLENRIGGSGGSLRFDVMMAIHRARTSNAPDVYRAAVVENVKMTIENLLRDSFATRKAVEANSIAVVGAVYDMHTGEVELLSDAGM